MTDPIIPTTWHDTTSARVEWSGAPADDLILTTLLEAARVQVLSYAGDGSEPGASITPAPNTPGYWTIVGGSSADVLGSVPVNYRLAQLFQARNLWNASKVDAGNGQIGEDTFVIRPFPMDWTVKALIRPPVAVPAMY